MSFDKRQKLYDQIKILRISGNRSRVMYKTLNQKTLEFIKSWPHFSRLHVYTEKQTDATLMEETISLSLFDMMKVNKNKINTSNVFELYYNIITNDWVGYFLERFRANSQAGKNGDSSEGISKPDIVMGKDSGTIFQDSERKKLPGIVGLVYLEMWSQDYNIYKKTYAVMLPESELPQWPPCIPKL